MKRKILSIICFALFFPWLITSLYSQAIDIDKARQYYNEVKTMADRDHGNLWGINLYGPLVFVDETTHEGVTNFPPPDKEWKKVQGLYFGKMPVNMGFANTALDWNGERWSMVIFSHLSENPKERMSLMIHELWHQHEQKLNILSEDKESKHLDQKMARVTLFLEWNALLKACQSKGEARNAAICDALSIRAMRFKLYPDARSTETAKEFHEGLAEYTGMTLSGMTDKEKIDLLQGKVTDRSSTKTMVWTFAYVAGPLYGYLIEHKAPGWTRKLQAGNDLGQILSENYHISGLSAEPSDLVRIGGPYGYDSIYSQELARESESLALQRTFRRFFTDEPVLFLPKKSLQITFNPAQITPYEGIGTVYGTLSAQDKWGKLEVKDSYALLLEGWNGILVPVGNSWNPELGLEGSGWKLELNEGYKVVRQKKGWQIIRTNESIKIEDYPFPEILKVALQRTEKVFQMDDKKLETIWPGYNLKKMPMAYWGSDFTCLMNRNEKPEGFHDTDIRINGFPVYYQSQGPFGAFSVLAWDSIHPIYLLALDERNEFDFYNVLYHEGFHTFQSTDPILKGNWGNPVDQPFFPINNAEFYSLGSLEQQILKKALTVEDTGMLRHLLSDYLVVVKYRQKMLTPKALAYEMGSNFHEGLATSVGYKAAALLTGQNLARVNLTKRLDRILINPGGWRNRGYGVGGTLALLFDRLEPEWIQQVKPKSTLEGLLEGLVLRDKQIRLSDIKREYDYTSIHKDIESRLLKEESRLADIVKQIDDQDHIEILLPSSWTSLGMNFNPLGIDRVGGLTIYHKQFIKVWKDSNFFLETNGLGVMTVLNKEDLFNIKKLLFGFSEGWEISLDDKLSDDLPEAGSFGSIRLKAKKFKLDMKNVTISTSNKTGHKVITFEVK